MTSSINPPSDSLLNNDLAQGALGVRGSTQFWHVDDSVHSRLWDLDRMRHVVIPEISSFWIDSQSDMDNSPQNSVNNFTLRQRWQTMRGPQDQKSSVDFLRFNAGATLVEHDVDNAPLPSKFFFSDPEPQYGKAPIANADFVNLGLARREQVSQNFSDHANGDWEWLISDTTAVLGGMNYNIHDGDISQADTGIAVQRTPRTSYYLGNLFMNDGDPYRQENADFITAGASYQLNRKYTFGAATQYDIERNSSAYNQIVIIRKLPRWYVAVSFSYDAERDSLGISLSLWPEGFDQFALGSKRLTKLAQ
jgi:hypothetical protein